MYQQIYWYDLYMYLLISLVSLNIYYVLDMLLWK